MTPSAFPRAAPAGSRVAAILTRLACLLCLASPATPAAAAPGATGDKPAPAPADREALAAEYRAWLDHGRTPARVVTFAVDRAAGFRVVDPLEPAPAPVSPGDRLIFVNRDRSALVVVIGAQPLVRGSRIIAAHIDTPSPRLDLSNLEKTKQSRLRARAYGGMRSHHWLHTPLAVVGRVARARGGAAPRTGPAEIPISLGLDDDFALYATAVNRRDRTLTIVAGSTPAGSERAMTLMRALHDRYGLTARDVQAAELYLVPKQRAREVGVDRALIGAHGQDDRANSYVAWRALMDLDRTPRRTAMTWLIDREEVGSRHATGARSRFLELVFAYLLRAQGEPATEAALGRAFARSQALSADTPPAMNPNWPEVHEPAHAPILGRGSALFPYTGRGGKQGGSAARAELVRSTLASFERAGAPVQQGLLGRVDEGGGGTVAKFLAHRGIDVVDIGVPAVSLHSPMELTAKDDLWTTYRGFRAWFIE